MTVLLKGIDGRDGDAAGVREVPAHICGVWLGENPPERPSGCHCYGLKAAEFWAIDRSSKGIDP